MSRRNRRSRRNNRTSDENQIRAEAARQEKLRSINRQGLTGCLIMLVGIGIVAAIFSSVGEAGIESNPAVIMPGMVIGCIGVLLVCIARWRKMFMSTRSFMTSMGKGAIKTLIEELN